jgi:hypothetical protein
VFDKISDTNMMERIFEAVTTHMDEDDREEALDAFERFQEATAPFDLEALLDCQEAIYAQRWEPFQVVKHDRGIELSTTQHLVLLRLSGDAAADYHEGAQNLFRMLEDCTEGKVQIGTKTSGSTELTLVDLPDDAPYRCSVAHIDDVILFSTSEEFARASLAMLKGNGHKSKFDDPRLAAALKQLPTPEDAIVFMDAKDHFDNVRKLLGVAQQHAGDNPAAQRWLGLANTIFDELAILDYLAVVEYTDGQRNVVEVMGQLLPDAEDRLLTQMLATGEPFEDWSSWVPAEATSYALSTGANLHPVYQRVVSYIRDHIPEMHLPLDNFEKWQRQVDLDLDVDLFQSFSGESVTIALPTERDSSWCSSEVVWATRCHKPARVRWLLDRLVEHLNEYEIFDVQELQLVDCEQLDGFQRVSATMLDLFDISPVVGFDDGWMYLGSSIEAVQKVLDTRGGDSPSIATTAAFQEFQLDVEGPVRGVMYVNLAEQTQQVAKLLKQAGAVLPLVIGMAESKAENNEELEELIPLRVLSELLPALGEIIGELDFLDSQLSVVHDGEERGSWHEHQVTIIRPAEDDTSQD